MSWERESDGRGRVARRGRALVVVLATAGCGAPTPPAPAGHPATSMLKGDRSTPKNLQASDNRPRGYAMEESPFHVDRMGIEEAASRRRAAHQEAHREQTFVAEQTAHPACRGVDREHRRECPLAAHGWRWGGRTSQRLVLVLHAAGLDVAALRRQLQCHLAISQSLPKATACPLTVPGVTMRLVQHGHDVELELTSNKAIQELEQRVRNIVP